MIFRNSFFLIVAFAVLCTSLLLSDTSYADNHNLTRTNDGENGKKDINVKDTGSDFIQGSTQRGPVKISIKLHPAKPIIGDILTLTLEVSAEEGVELLMPEFGQSMERFNIVDFVPRKSIDNDGRSLAIHRYRLQTPSSGPHAIPPLMIEFVDRRPGNRLAPEGEDAYEVLTERLEFNVESVVPTGAANEMKAPLRELAPLGVGKSKLWIGLIAVLVLSLLGLPFAWRVWQKNRILSRRRSAFDIAYSRLNKLRLGQNPEADEVSTFFVELSDIVRHYLEDRFDLHAPELTTEEFLEVAATSPDLTLEHKSFLQEFLRQADQVKFAQYIPDTESINKALRSATNFIEQTKQDAPMLDESSASQSLNIRKRSGSESTLNSVSREETIVAEGEKEMGHD